MRGRLKEPKQIRFRDADLVPDVTQQTTVVRTVVFVQRHHAALTVVGSFPLFMGAVGSHAIEIESTKQIRHLAVLYRPLHAPPESARPRLSAFRPAFRRGRSRPADWHPEGIRDDGKPVPSMRRKRCLTVQQLVLKCRVSSLRIDVAAEVEDLGVHLLPNFRKRVGLGGQGKVHAVRHPDAVFLVREKSKFFSHRLKSIIVEQMMDHSPCATPGRANNRRFLVKRQ